jgi:hypothetical protein
MSARPAVAGSPEGGELGGSELQLLRGNGDAGGDWRRRDSIP